MISFSAVVLRVQLLQYYCTAQRATYLILNTRHSHNFQKHRFRM